MTQASARALWTSDELVSATGGVTSGTWDITGITSDSRTVHPGDLFIALKNEDFKNVGGGSVATDGHTFIADALSRGAAGVIAETVPDSLKDDPRILKVGSTFRALMDMAESARARMGARVIGITGSVGKTSTRDMLALCLNAFGPTHQTQKSFNNILGVPLTLSLSPRESDYAIIEMGMDRAGELPPLTKMTRPHIALITNIAPAHMAYFSDGMAGIARAKAEIFAGLDSSGVAILPRDSDYFDILKQEAATHNASTILSFGTHPSSDARILSMIEARNGTKVEAEILGAKITYTIAGGAHMAMNALSALLVVGCLGLDIARAARALAAFSPLEGRGKEEHLNIGDPSNPVILIDESYNANPASMNAAFRVVALIDPGRGGRRIAILGDMLELGEQGPKLHADLALPLRAANIDLVYTCGALMKNLHDALPANNRGAHKENSLALAQIVPDVLVPGDVVVVKGSHGSRMDLVVEALRALPTTRTAASIQENKETNKHAL